MKSKAVLLLIGIFLLLPPCGRHALAELKLTPTLTGSEIWTDNLFNEERDKRSEFITRLIPAIAFDYEAPRLEADLAYALDYRFYAKNERGSESVHFLDGRALLNHDEWAFLEITEQIARVSLDSTRDFREESLFQNQSDRNVFSISPYLQFRPSLRSTVKGGYRFVKTDYEEDSGTDRKNHLIFLEAAYELSDRTTLRGGYLFVEEDSDQEDHRKQDVWSGLRWQLGKNTSAFGTVGFTWISFDDGPDQDDVFWDFGLSHDFGLLVGTAALGVNYLEDPEGTILRQENYRVAVSRDWSRSRLSATASVSDYFDVDIDELDTRRFGISGTLNHELSPRWSGALTVSADKFEDKVDDTWTRRLIGRLGLSYLFAEDLTATMNYDRIDSHSPEDPDDRYETNQVILEVRKVF